MAGIFRRRKTWKIALVLGALIIGLVAVPRSASAHPLGNFTINRFSRIEIGAASVKVYYVLDIAEIPTYQEKLLIDSNGDGQVSDTERQAYLDIKAKQLIAGMQLTLNNTPATLTETGADLSFLQGQGGLQTTRITAQFETGPLPKSATSLAFQDSNYSDRVGWKEIVIRNASGVALNTASVPATSASDELRTYPQDMLTSPLDVRAAQAEFKLDPSVVVNDTSISPAAQGVIDRSQDPFADLLKTSEVGFGFIIFALGAAFVLGMGHALTPGHGKTVVAAYLVGTRGTARHALFLGATVTITHTLGVFALGFLTLFASQYIVPDKLYPYLNLLSGLLVLVMGATLFRSRLRAAFFGGQGHGHSHEPVPAHSHSYDFATAMPADEMDDHTHDHIDGSHVHSHGGTSHSHLPPGGDGSPVTWKKLALFGISAGLLPCPSALVVMLSSIALGQVAFGLVLIVFFSLGLAAALTGIGFLFVYARPLMTRVKADGLSRVIRYAPVLGAFIVTIVGVAISYDGFAQTGLLAR